MKRKVLVDLTLEAEEYDALQVAADQHDIESVEKWLEIVVLGELATLMADHHPILSEEELRELKNQFASEEWSCDIDDEIPF